MLQATTTNAITNGLHASFLLAYLIGAFRSGFSRPLVGLFFLLFALKVMGVFVHYRPNSQEAMQLWGVIALSTVALNLLVLREAGVPRKQAFFAAGIFVVATGIFLTGVNDFSYIALPTALVFWVAACHTPRGSKLRLGLAMVVGSNLVWFAARKIGGWAFGGVVPLGVRYDNDLYHFLLIISTYVIYKGFRERGRYPAVGGGAVIGREPFHLSPMSDLERVE